MEPRDLRSWLICAPRPAAVRIAAADGQKHELAISNGMKWIDVAKSVCALGPTVVEALDSKGTLLRAVRVEDLDEPEEENDEGAIAVSDPESQRLVIFARLLADAYANSKAFTEMAFDKLGELFTAVSKRSESQEKTISALDRMVQKLVLEKVAAGGGDGEEPLTLNSLLNGFLQGKLQAEADTKANGTSNGVPHKEGNHE